MGSHTLFTAGLVFEMIGTLVGIGIYALSYGVFVGRNEDSCFDSTRQHDINKVPNVFVTLVELFYAILILLGTCLSVPRSNHWWSHHIVFVNNIFHC